jgi:hypothetical protein
MLMAAATKKEKKRKEKKRKEKKNTGTPVLVVGT